MSFSTWAKERHGPLPNWGYLIAGGVGVFALWYFWTHRRTPTTQQTPSTGVPSTTGFDSGGGGSFTQSPPTQTTPPVTNVPVTAQTPLTTTNPPLPVNTPVTAQAPITQVPIAAPAPAPAPAPAGPSYAYGTPPGEGWIIAPPGAPIPAHQIITDAYGLRWWKPLEPGHQVGVLNGSGGYTGQATDPRADAWVNTMTLHGLEGVVPRSFLDPSIPFGSPEDAVLSVPGTPGWEYEQSLARGFEQGLQAGLPPQQAAAQEGVGYMNTGQLPDYVNTPQWIPMLSQQTGIPQSYLLGQAPAAPAVAPLNPQYQSQNMAPQYSMANPNPNPPPYPPPAPPPIPSSSPYAAPEQSYGGGFGNLQQMPIGLSL